MRKVILVAIALLAINCNNRNSNSDAVARTPILEDFVIGNWISTAFAHENNASMTEIPEEEAVKISFEVENICKMTMDRNTEFYNYSVNGKKITLKGEDDDIKFIIIVDSIKNEMLYTHMGIPASGYARMKFVKNK